MVFVSLLGLPKNLAIISMRGSQQIVRCTIVKVALVSYSKILIPAACVRLLDDHAVRLSKGMYATGLYPVFTCKRKQHTLFMQTEADGFWKV